MKGSRDPLPCVRAGGPLQAEPVDDAEAHDAELVLDTVGDGPSGGSVPQQRLLPERFA